MRPLLAVACLVLLTATLAGCAEDAERYPDGVPSQSTSRSSTGTSTTTGTGTQSATRTSTGPAGNGTGNETGNHPPMANITADPINGTAPLNVTFTLAGSDADGDALNWTLSFGDGSNATNGTSLPAEVTHSYNATGNFTAVLRVADAQGDQASVNVTIQVSGGAPAAPDLHCHRTPTQTAGPTYVYSGDGGDWVFTEDNGIAGLQVANNHPGGGNFHNPAWVDCPDGDMQVF